MLTRHDVGKRSGLAAVIHVARSAPDCRSLPFTSCFTDFSALFRLSSRRFPQVLFLDSPALPRTLQLEQQPHRLERGKAHNVHRF
jgi:hypothetical protein